MPNRPRRNIRTTVRTQAAPAAALLLLTAACGHGPATGRAGSSNAATPARAGAAASSASHTSLSGVGRSAAGSATAPGTAGPASLPPSVEPAGQLTLAFAGDVHFAGRTADRLADPAHAFGPAAAVLSRADLTMVNLETAIAVGGSPEAKSFTFSAPPLAFTALRDAGVDLATMANNHGADFGAAGLRQTLNAVAASHFPVIGIGANAQAAFAPYIATINGVRVAILAASQVQDETLAHFSASPTSAGIANAYSDALITAVRAARSRADVVVVYVHWGTEYQSCPNADQRNLADALAAAGATAVVGTHAHVLQGAGWRTDGRYVAYGLGNYFWWRSFGNEQDDNGVLTLTIAGNRVVAARFDPSHLDERGIGVPAAGSTREHILAEWERVRLCSGLAAHP